MILTNIPKTSQYSLICCVAPHYYMFTVFACSDILLVVLCVSDSSDVICVRWSPVHSDPPAGALVSLPLVFNPWPPACQPCMSVPQEPCMNPEPCVNCTTFCVSCRKLALTLYKTLNPCREFSVIEITGGIKLHLASNSNTILKMWKIKRSCTDAWYMHLKIIEIIS